MNVITCKLTHEHDSEKRNQTRTAAVFPPRTAPPKLVPPPLPKRILLIKRELGAQIKLRLRFDVEHEPADFVRIIRTREDGVPEKVCTCTEDGVAENVRTCTGGSVQVRTHTYLFKCVRTRRMVMYLFKCVRTRRMVYLRKFVRARKMVYLKMFVRARDSTYVNR